MSQQCGKHSTFKPRIGQVLNNLRAYGCCDEDCDFWVQRLEPESRHAASTVPTSSSTASIPPRKKERRPKLDTTAATWVVAATTL
mmetsp:Transcript_45197/g.86952  ORF Transcript_45197/g.86952 Transcript_45197/m.86952 type:complete len:85 (-) Transcript_45197:119-373(-)